MVRKMNLTIRLESLGEHGISTKIRGMSSPREDVATWDAKGCPEDYLIIINSDCTEELQTAAFLHELLHLWHDDLRTKHDDIPFLERIRNKETEEMLTVLTKEGVTR